MRYAILGPVELCDGERRMAAGGSRQVALLALLLVDANRVVARDRLIEAVWADQPAAGALKRLHVAIVRLRRVLGRDGADSVLRTVAGGYRLAVRPGELDADVFEDRVGEGRRMLQAGDAPRAHGALREALGMWRGTALAGVTYAEFAQPELRRLEELRLAALELRVECELRVGGHGAVIGELEALVAAHPGHEGFVAQLMRALYRCGRQGEALDAYALARAYLAGELGLEPGSALRSLQADVLAQSPTLRRDSDDPRLAVAVATRRVAVATEVVTRSEANGGRDGGAGRSANDIALSIPQPLLGGSAWPFVGREAELARLLELWDGVRDGKRSAVIIGGEAGVGKTRLASELAQAVHHNDALVLYGCCDERLVTPYQPFVEALRPTVQAFGPDRLRAQLGNLASELGQLFPELGGLGEPARADPESERFTLFEAVAALLGAVTSERRALLVIDDLHSAASPTLLLLRHLIRCERSLRVLLLGTFRVPGLESGGPLARLLADLQRDVSAQHVRLGELDEDAIAMCKTLDVGAVRA